MVEIAGIDGSGKSTLIDSLVGWGHRRAVLTYEWTLRSSTRRMIDAVRFPEDPDLASKLAGNALELAVCTELIREVNAVPTARMPGQLVVVDNYIRGWVANVAQSSASIIPEVALLYQRLVHPPDLSLELELEPTVAHSRILDRAKLDPSLQYGGIDYLTNRACAFRETRALCKYPVDIINGEQLRDDIFEEARNLILSRSKNLDPALWFELNRSC